MHSILVVDDEQSIRDSFSLILEGKYKVLLAASGEGALKTIADQKVDMTYLDIRMPGMDGLETLKRVKEIDPSLEIIMITAVNDVQKASEAIKHGARDYIVKPFDVEHITKLTEQILRKKALLEQGSEVQKKAGPRAPELVGQTEKIANILRTIDKIKNDQRVLILGEAGTEKETVAWIIHEKSPRRSFPFIPVRLSPEISAQQMSKMFFGWDKGNSTVDLEAKSGLFEQCREGTLFIDSLQLLPNDIFKKLSFLEFSRQGSFAKIAIEARLIGGATADLATNKEIFDYFSEVCIEIPPLRERSSDISLLVNRSIEKYNSQYNKNVKIDPAALESLTNYTWPGNVKQLESLIEQLILSNSGDQIIPEDLPIDILIESAESAGSGFLPTFEKEYLQSVLKQCGKNKEKAASLLGINPTILESKL